MKDFTNQTCREFVDLLASNEPMPGGGAAAALVGAIGVALGSMVGNLTIGREKYADVEELMKNLVEKCAVLKEQMLAQALADAEGFIPLANAYAMDKSDPTRDDMIDKGCIIACEVPLKSLELCGEALEMLKIYYEKGTRLAFSDAVCGAVMLRSVMESASVNIYINTNTLRDKAKAKEINDKCDDMLSKYIPLSDEIYNDAKRSLTQY